ncbi:hypothetical protein ANCCAN_20947 [Ancylostoma caninum]|uniref:Uncharacterized protein n=1 Tax=Ancylostoma caninum TaxID=29170 RepID=A0A368FQY8_ANCCA|nr:hypothetical protein ANCCAN_20947 [Ancylostoma caninum]
MLLTKHQELQRWAEQLHLAFVSDSFFWKWFLWCKPAIEKVYQQHQQKVLDVVRRKYGGTEGLHIAADGVFDSRGYSALIGKEAKNKGCIPLSVWYEKLKTHMWTAIEVCEGERIRHIFNTCLKHVQDVHPWPKDEITGKFTRCGHPPLEGPRPETIMEGTPAFHRLSHLVLNKNLQKDLTKASPRGGTSICESKNALDRLYCRKEIFCPLFTYKLSSMLSTMHFNTHRVAEMAGERRVQRVIDVQRKYFRRTTRMVFKTPVEHLWRDQIAQAVPDARREHHELPPEDVDLQGMIDAEAAFEEAEPENIFEDIDSDDEKYEEEL